MEVQYKQGLLGGFSLVELIIITAVVVFLTTSLFETFGRSAQESQRLRRGSVSLTSDIRRAQSLAISSFRFLEEDLCGYGIHYVDSRTYQIYKGIRGGVSCASGDHRYNPGGDSIYRLMTLSESDIIFSGQFPDIFFEPPDPKIYIDNNASLSGPAAQINLCIQKGSPCVTISVYPSGRIDAP